HLVGLPDNAVKESSYRIAAALSNIGYQLPGKKITINMAPADMRKEGSAYDLPIAVGVLSASGQLRKEDFDDCLIMGELSLDGSVQPIKGTLPIVLQAKKEGFKKVFLPKDNELEGAIVDGISVYGVENLLDLIHHFENKTLITPPGSGKTMLAKRIPSILPPMTLEEALETTKIHSIVGKAQNIGLIKTRPFRSPHHTASSVSLVGGGSYPQPGEISLAHNGV